MLFLKKSYFSLFFALIYAAQSLFLTPLAEANFWRQRQAGRISNIQTSVESLPSVSSQLTESKIRHADTLTWFPSSGPAWRVVHIQDIHRNREAQTGISEFIGGVMEREHPDVLALEGAFGPMPIEVYHREISARARALVADALLVNGTMAGAVHALWRASTRNLPYVVGVDDQTLYDQNVRAFRDAHLWQNVMSRELSAQRERLALKKKSVFNAVLLEYDRATDDYYDGKIKLGAWLSKALPAAPSPVSPMIERFVRALSAESHLDFARVERQRADYLAALSAHATKEDMGQLMRAAMDYKAGRISDRRFYDGVTALGVRVNVPLTQYPALQAYLEYVALADGIRGPELLSAASTLETETYQRLTESKAERALIDQGRLLRLTRKLIHFELTADEWRDYQHAVARFPRSGDLAHLKPFEDFYSTAQARDQKMADNVLAAVHARRAKKILLVTGGFHSGGMEKALADAGGTVVRYTPKLTRVEGADGATYLNVFLSERTPLEQMVAGPRLFLSPPLESAADTLERTTLALGADLMTGVTTPPAATKTFERMAKAFHLAGYAVEFSKISAERVTGQLVKWRERLTRFEEQLSRTADGRDEIRFSWSKPQIVLGSAALMGLGLLLIKTAGPQMIGVLLWTAVAGVILWIVYEQRPRAPLALVATLASNARNITNSLVPTIPHIFHMDGESAAPPATSSPSTDLSERKKLLDWYAHIFLPQFRNIVVAHSAAPLTKSEIEVFVNTTIRRFYPEFLPGAWLNNSATMLTGPMLDLSISNEVQEQIFLPRGLYLRTINNKLYAMNLRFGLSFLSPIGHLISGHIGTYDGIGDPYDTGPIAISGMNGIYISDKKAEQLKTKLRSVAGYDAFKTMADSILRDRSVDPDPLFDTYLVIGLGIKSDAEYIHSKAGPDAYARLQLALIQNGKMHLKSKLNTPELIHAIAGFDLYLTLLDKNPLFIFYVIADSVASTKFPPFVDFHARLLRALGEREVMSFDHWTRVLERYQYRPTDFFVKVQQVAREMRQEYYVDDAERAALVKPYGLHIDHVRDQNIAIPIKINREAEELRDLVDWFDHFYNRDLVKFLELHTLGWMLESDVVRFLNNAFASKFSDYQPLPLPAVDQPLFADDAGMFIEQVINNHILFPRSVYIVQGREGKTEIVKLLSRERVTSQSGDDITLVHATTLGVPADIAHTGNYIIKDNLIALTDRDRRDAARLVDELESIIPGYKPRRFVAARAAMDSGVPMEESGLIALRTQNRLRQSFWENVFRRYRHLEFNDRFEFLLRPQSPLHTFYHDKDDAGGAVADSEMFLVTLYNHPELLLSAIDVAQSILLSTDVPPFWFDQLMSRFGLKGTDPSKIALTYFTLVAANPNEVLNKSRQYLADIYQENFLTQTEMASVFVHSPEFQSAQLPLTGRNGLLQYEQRHLPELLHRVMGAVQNHDVSILRQYEPLPAGEMTEQNRALWNNMVKIVEGVVRHTSNDHVGKFRAVSRILLYKWYIPRQLFIWDFMQNNLLVSPDGFLICPIVAEYDAIVELRQRKIYLIDFPRIFSTAFTGNIFIPACEINGAIYSDVIGVNRQAAKADLDMINYFCNVPEKNRFVPNDHKDLFWNLSQFTYLFMSTLIQAHLADEQQLESDDPYVQIGLPAALSLNPFRTVVLRFATDIQNKLENRIDLPLEKFVERFLALAARPDEKNPINLLVGLTMHELRKILYQLETAESPLRLTQIPQFDLPGILSMIVEDRVPSSLLREVIEWVWGDIQTYFYSYGIKHIAFDEKNPVENVSFLMEQKLLHQLITQLWEWAKAPETPFALPDAWGAILNPTAIKAFTEDVYLARKKYTGEVSPSDHRLYMDLISIANKRLFIPRGRIILSQKVPAKGVATHEMYVLLKIYKVLDPVEIYDHPVPFYALNKIIAEAEAPSIGFQTIGPDSFFYIDVEHAARNYASTPAINSFEKAFELEQPGLENDRRRLWILSRIQAQTMTVASIGALLMAGGNERKIKNASLYSILMSMNPLAALYEWLHTSDMKTAGESHLTSLVTDAWRELGVSARDDASVENVEELNKLAKLSPQALTRLAREYIDPAVKTYPNVRANWDELFRVIATFDEKERANAPRVEAQASEFLTATPKPGSPLPPASINANEEQSSVFPLVELDVLYKQAAEHILPTTSRAPEKVEFVGSMSRRMKMNVEIFVKEELPKQARHPSQRIVFKAEGDKFKAAWDTTGGIIISIPLTEASKKDDAAIRAVLLFILHQMPSLQETKVKLYEPQLLELVSGSKANAGLAKKMSDIDYAELLSVMAGMKKFLEMNREKVARLSDKEAIHLRVWFLNKFYFSPRLVQIFPVKHVRGKKLTMEVYRVDYPAGTIQIMGQPFEALYLHGHSDDGLIVSNLISRQIITLIDAYHVNYQALLHNPARDRKHPIGALTRAALSGFPAQNDESLDESPYADWLNDFCRHAAPVWFQSNPEKSAQEIVKRVQKEFNLDTKPQSEFNTRVYNSFCFWALYPDHDLTFLRYAAKRMIPLDKKSEHVEPIELAAIPEPDCPWFLPLLIWAARRMGVWDDRPIKTWGELVTLLDNLGTAIRQHPDRAYAVQKDIQALADELTGGDVSRVRAQLNQARRSPDNTAKRKLIFFPDSDYLRWGALVKNWKFIEPEKKPERKKFKKMPLPVLRRPLALPLIRAPFRKLSLDVVFSALPLPLVAPPEKVVEPFKKLALATLPAPGIIVDKQAIPDVLDLFELASNPFAWSQIVDALPTFAKFTGNAVRQAEAAAWMRSIFFRSPDLASLRAQQPSEEMMLQLIGAFGLDEDAIASYWNTTPEHVHEWLKLPFVDYLLKLGRAYQWDFQKMADQLNVPLRVLFDWVTNDPLSQVSREMNAAVPLTPDMRLEALVANDGDVAASAQSLNIDPSDFSEDELDFADTIRTTNLYEVAVAEVINPGQEENDATVWIRTHYPRLLDWVTRVSKHRPSIRYYTDSEAYTIKDLRIADHAAAATHKSETISVPFTFRIYIAPEAMESYHFTRIIVDGAKHQTPARLKPVPDHPGEFEASGSLLLKNRDKNKKNVLSFFAVDSTKQRFRYVRGPQQTVTITYGGAAIDALQRFELFRGAHTPQTDDRELDIHMLKQNLQAALLGEFADDPKNGLKKLDAMVAEAQFQQQPDNQRALLELRAKFDSAQEGKFPKLKTKYKRSFPERVALQELLDRFAASVHRSVVLHSPWSRSVLTSLASAVNAQGGNVLIVLDADTGHEWGEALGALRESLNIVDITQGSIKDRNTAIDGFDHSPKTIFVNPNYLLDEKNVTKATREKLAADVKLIIVMGAHNLGAENSRLASVLHDLTPGDAERVMRIAVTNVVAQAELGGLFRLLQYVSDNVVSSVVPGTGKKFDAENPAHLQQLFQLLGWTLSRFNPVVAVPTAPLSDKTDSANTMIPFVYSDIQMQGLFALAVNYFLDPHLQQFVDRDNRIIHVIDHWDYVDDSEKENKLLVAAAASAGRTLILVRHRNTMDRLKEKLDEEGIDLLEDAGVYNNVSDLKRFRSPDGPRFFLSTYNRWADAADHEMSGIDNVILYDPPRNVHDLLAVQPDQNAGPRLHILYGQIPGDWFAQEFKLASGLIRATFFPESTGYEARRWERVKAIEKIMRHILYLGAHNSQLAQKVKDLQRFLDEKSEPEKTAIAPSSYYDAKEATINTTISRILGEEHQWFNNILPWVTMAHEDAFAELIWLMVVLIQNKVGDPVTDGPLTRHVFETGTGVISEIPYKVGKKSETVVVSHDGSELLVNKVPLSSYVGPWRKETKDVFLQIESAMKSVVSQPNATLLLRNWAFAFWLLGNSSFDKDQKLHRLRDMHAKYISQQQLVPIDMVELKGLVELFADSGNDASKISPRLTLVTSQWLQGFLLGLYNLKHHTAQKKEFTPAVQAWLELHVHDYWARGDFEGFLSHLLSMAERLSVQVRQSNGNGNGNGHGNGHAPALTLGYGMWGPILNVLSVRQVSRMILWPVLIVLIILEETLFSTLMTRGGIALIAATILFGVMHTRAIYFNGGAVAVGPSTTWGDKAGAMLVGLIYRSPVLVMMLVFPQMPLWSGVMVAVLLHLGDDLLLRKNRNVTAPGFWDAFLQNKPLKLSVGLVGHQNLKELSAHEWRTIVGEVPTIPLANQLGDRHLVTQLNASQVDRAQQLLKQLPFTKKLFVLTDAAGAAAFKEYLRRTPDARTRLTVIETLRAYTIDEVESGVQAILDRGVAHDQLALGFFEDSAIHFTSRPITPLSALYDLPVFAINDLLLGVPLAVTNWQELMQQVAVRAAQA